MVQWIVKDSETEEEHIANMGKVVALWPSKVEQSDTFMWVADFQVFPPLPYHILKIGDTGDEPSIMVWLNTLLFSHF